MKKKRAFTPAQTVRGRNFVTGFTLLEILVAMIILSLTVGGLFAVLLSARRGSTHDRNRVIAAELGRFWLDELQMQVRQDQWLGAGNCLCQTCTGAANCQGAQTVNGTDFTPTFTIDDVAGTTAPLKRVRLRIQWHTPQI